MRCRTAFIRILAVGAVFSGLTACSTFVPTPESLGEQSSGFGYVPLDGLPVDHSMDADSCKEWSGKPQYKNLFASLPDTTIRYAVASVDQSGGLTFGPIKVTAKNRSYRAVLDYVNADVMPVDFLVKARMGSEIVALSDVRPGSVPEGYEVALVDERMSRPDQGGSVITFPIYVGIGMRMTADITALESGLPLFSLGAIGVEAQQQNLVGTLTVQTIGVSGGKVAAGLPLPSKLDQTTVENGLLSMGATRALLYQEGADGDGIHRTPRVVGLYSPIGADPVLVNAIYSELAKKRPKWPRPCKEVASRN